MSGREEYETQTKREVNNILEKNPEYLRDYYSYISINKTLRTRVNYLRSVSSFVNSVGKELKDLKTSDFRGYIAQLKDNTSSTNSARTYAALKAFGLFLVSEDILESDPMQLVPRPKKIESRETKERREKGVLEKREIKKVIKSIENGVGSSRSKARQKDWENRDMLIVKLFLMTGMRCSALMTIDVSDIDLDTLKLVVYDKGDKVNDYYLAPEIVPLIQSWLSDREVLLGDCKENALFISNQRRRMSQKSISRVVEKYSSVIEGKHITPHKLRATYGTQIYAATHDIYYTQQCMKHNSSRTTELYIRGESKDTSKASNIMANLL